MFTFLYSLRFRLFLLLGLALLPLLGLTLRTAFAQREQAAAQAKAEAMRMTRLVVSNQNTLTAGGHHLLIALAQLPEIRSGDPAGCSALLAELLKQYPVYTNLGVAALNGDLLCSALPTSGPINYADREWFPRVLQTRNFVVGESVVGRITGKATMPLAYPVMNEAGELEFVVFAGIDLAFVNQLMATAQFPEGTVVTVLDGDGTILARYPDPEQWVGKTPQDAPLVQVILTQGEGTVEMAGVDGVQRLYAFSPLGEAPHVEGYVSVGIPSQVAYAAVNRILFNNLIGLGLAAILTFAAAWLGGEFFVLRRTRALARTAQQLTSGDLSARTGITRPRGELSQLGHAFDQMAAALQQRQEALRKNEAHYRAVVEDQTELICRFKPDGTLIFVNENYCRYYDKTNDELIGNSFIPLAHGEQPKKLRKYLASFSREKPVATFEQQEVMP
ncbi:MAG: HAMP domain-containing protein, partial [Anaerolineales bacterium]|nr:HAMP domain-containing protein [Anaerolineales bacterium]